MALILPKGLVVNTSEIEGHIERINAEPLDPSEIANFWKGILDWQTIAKVAII